MHSHRRFSCHALCKVVIKIAREENMPPYIIFSDNTLIDMAARTPITKQEMLNVYGVGENKYLKYGERFIDVVNECIKLYPELIEGKITGEPIEEKKVKNRKNAGKCEFSLLVEEAEKYQYTGYRLISEIRDEMNRICERDNVKRLPVTRLTEIVMKEGLIAVEEADGRFVKVLT